MGILTDWGVLKGCGKGPWLAGGGGGKDGAGAVQSNRVEDCSLLRQ